MGAANGETDDQVGIRGNERTASPKRADGVQIEKPIPPWEMPGYFRMDCESHRANFLMFWAAVALFSSLAGFPIPYLSFLALLLAGITWHLANVDLKKMGRGLMDPASEIRTDNARAVSRAACAFSTSGIIVWSIFILFILWIERN